MTTPSKYDDDHELIFQLLSGFAMAGVLASVGENETVIVSQIASASCDYAEALMAEVKRRTRQKV